MKKKVKFKIKETKMSVFCISVFLTIIAAFWLPVINYFLPKAADALGFEYEVPELELATADVFSLAGESNTDEGGGTWD